MRYLLNNIVGILIALLFLAVLVYLPNIISSTVDKGFGEVGQKIRSVLSTYGNQMQSRHLKDTSGKGEDTQEQGQDCNKTERHGGFPDFYIVPHSLSKSKDGGEEPFDDFYAGGKH